MNDGLRAKYIVRKAETGETVENCFVLRPEKDAAAIAAIRAYAAATNNPALSADLLRWVGPSPNDPLTLDELREMDGDWAWIEGPEHPGQWVKIMCVGGTYRMVRISFFVGETADAEVLMLFHGAKLYRRKPEGV